MKKLKKVLVLLSGGIDSAVCLQMAREETEDVTTLFFGYGQRQEHEEAQAAIEQGLGHVKWMRQQIDLSLLRNGESMLNPNRTVTPQTMIIPLRNLLFLTYAAVLAEEMNFHEIWLGVNRDDAPHWPDCRKQFIEQFERMIPYCTVGGHGFTIRTPLYELPKKLIVQLAFAMNIPLEKTWSCYNPQLSNTWSEDQGPAVREPCGECPACLSRNEAIRVLEGHTDDEE